VLVVCPLSVALNWKRECERWLVRPMRVGLATAREWPGDADVVVVHWAIVARHAQAMRATVWDLLVLDEAHYAKNPQAARTKAVLGEGRKGGAGPVPARRRVALTGTPIPNRPIELWPILRWLDPVRWGSWYEYVVRYCDAFQDRFGWNVSGASNLGELQERLRSTVMIRRRKADVLKELPPKTRQVLALAPRTDEQRRLVREEQRIAEEAESEVARAAVAVELARVQGDQDAFRAAMAVLRDAVRVAFSRLSEVRHRTALAKVPDVVEHVRDVLEGSEGKKVVVWTHHRDALDRIAEELQGGEEPVRTVRIWGGMSPEERAAAVEAFQNDPEVRVFLGTIGAAAEGITLTASDHAVFAELDWVPGKVRQAEDRIHRIGQNMAVTVQFLVLEGSLDARIAEALAEKGAVSEQALDAEGAGEGGGEELEAAVALGARPSTASVRRPVLEAVAARLTPRLGELVHAALRTLAAADEDRAMWRNGVGFSKADVALGHELASLAALTPRQAALGAVLLARYRRQLAGLDGDFAAFLDDVASLSAKPPVRQPA